MTEDGTLPADAPDQRDQVDAARFIKPPDPPVHTIVLPPMRAAARTSAAARRFSTRTVDAADILVGHRLRRLREARGLSLDDVAMAIGVTPAQVHHYETGRSSIGIGRLVAAARALGVPVTVFLQDVADAEKQEAAPAPSFDLVTCVIDMLALPAHQRQALGDLIRSFNDQNGDGAACSGPGPGSTRTTASDR